MNVRMERVRELIRRELSMVLDRTFQFPNQLVTLHDVDPATDLKSCRCYVGVLGGKDDQRAAVIERLQAARPTIQRELYKRVKLKNSPQLWFHLDNSAERGVRIVNAIDNLPPIVEDYGIPEEEPPNRNRKAMSTKPNPHDDEEIENEEEEELEEEEEEETQESAEDEEGDFDDEDEEWEEDEEDEEDEEEEDEDDDEERAYTKE
jgi:ribosome-binding factor A